MDDLNTYNSHQRSTNDANEPIKFPYLYYVYVKLITWRNGD